jgi:hypothetical protein
MRTAELPVRAKSRARLLALAHVPVRPGEVVRGGDPGEVVLAIQVDGLDEGPLAARDRHVGTARVVVGGGEIGGGGGGVRVSGYPPVGEEVLLVEPGPAGR